MENYLLGITSSIITAVIASYLTARWSLKKFYTEKWWDRKEKAYADIVDALNDHIQYLEIQKEDFGQGLSVSPKKARELYKTYHQARWKLKRIINIGAFLVSPDAEKTLNKLNTRPRLRQDENPPLDIYESEYDYFKNALKEIIDIARADLKSC